MLQTVLALALYCAAAQGGCIYPAGSNQSPASAESAPAAQDVPKDTVITLERTVCYGTCPAYKLTIYADGKVVFEGAEYVRKTGRFEARVSRDKVQELLTAFREINYFDLKNNYSEKDCPQWWTDHPTAQTSLTINGRSKTVRHYYGCAGLEVLDRLSKLESKIDKTVNVDQWVK